MSGDRPHLNCKNMNKGTLTFVNETHRSAVFICNSCNDKVDIIACKSFYDYHPELNPYRKT